MPSKSILIAGKISDAKNGFFISGASISVKGSRQQTTSDATGQFRISVNSLPATINIAAVGYETFSIEVTDTVQTLTISLLPKTQSLQDVVAMGYSNQKQKRLSGQYESVPAPEPGFPSASTLQGQGAGVPTSRGYLRSDMLSGKRRAPGTDKFAAGDSLNDDGANREGYDAIVENRFQQPADHPLSTFSIDVDGASYSNVRRLLKEGQWPTEGAVRLEEFINYFHYRYPQPTGQDPFSINTEISACPWNTRHQLVMIGLQGKKIPVENLPASNLVFLIDVSGSMDEPNKLPLVKSSLRLLVEQMRPQDRVSLVVYAGNAGMVLAPTSGSEKEKIRQAIDALEAGGSTAGGEGIRLAYATAKNAFISGGNNRVILCTDGDFNVGASSDSELEKIITRQRESGIFLTVLGYGTGNYQDAKMEKLADKGNGNHAYIDDMTEANKVLVNEFGGTMFTIAKDVKLQVEFNPALVGGYRLIGYENRMMQAEDFNNDKKDAGELGSGHTVTALYEIIPAGIKDTLLERVDGLKYQHPAAAAAMSQSKDWCTVKFRYKKPNGDKSILMEKTITPDANTAAASENFRLASAAAQFGLLLRQSEFKENASWTGALKLVKGTLDQDTEGYRAELAKLIRLAGKMAPEGKSAVPDDDDLSAR